MRLRIASVLTFLVFVAGVMAAAQTSSTASSSPNSAPYTGRIYDMGPGITVPTVISYKKDASVSQDQVSAGKKKVKSGDVALAVVVDPEGNPRNIKVVKKLSPPLDQEAIAMLQTWKFKPAVKDGKPVAVRLEVTIHFHPS